MSVSIPKVASDFETALDQAVAEGATTAALVSILDTDGVSLANGYYGFTIDNETDYKEYILCTLTGTALTSIFSVSDQGVATSGFANYHRRGASVQITDHVSLRRVVEALTGSIGLNGGTPLYYDATPSLGSGLQLATVQYVLDTFSSTGTVSFNATTIAADAGENVASGDWVYQLATDGEWYLTDADIATKCLGVRIGKARGAGTNGNSIAGGVFIGGLETVGTYTPGQAYYLSNTAGALSTTAGTNSVLVGYGDANSDLILRTQSQSAVDASTGSIGTPSNANRFVTEQNAFSNVDQSQTTGSTAQSVGEANATTKQNKIAQSFIPTVTKIRGARLYKSANTGTFTGTVTVSLQADSSGNPSGSALATVTLTNAYYNALPVGEFQATFAAEYASLVPETLYWIVIETSTSDNSNHPNLGSNAAGGYTNGSAKYNNTTNGWVTITSVDLYFKTLGSVLSQFAKTDATGAIPPETVKGLLLAVPPTAGSAATGSIAETTSYSGTIDTTNLFSPLKRILVRFTATVTFANNSGQSSTIRLKIGGVTMASFAMTATNATSPTGTVQVESYIYTNASGTISAQNRFLQNTTTSITSSALTVSNTALASQPALDSASPILITFQHTDTGFTGTATDVIVERL